MYNVIPAQAGIQWWGKGRPRSLDCRQGGAILRLKWLNARLLIGFSPQHWSIGDGDRVRLRLHAQVDLDLYLHQVEAGRH